MSFKEKLIRAKKAVIMGALAVAAVIATPAKGQTKESVPTEKDAVTAVASQDAIRQEQFEKAVRSGAPREEIAKHIDFPEFIPVTKNGQFDNKKASEWAKKLAPYMKTLAEKGDKITTAEAYKAFKDATGQENISLEDFERVRKMAEEAVNKQKYKIPGLAVDAIFILVLTGVTLPVGAASLLFIPMAIENFRESRGDKVLARMKKTANPLFIGACMAAFAYMTGKPAVRIGKEFVDLLREKPEQTVQKAYEGMYNSYVTQSIQAQKKQFKQVEFEGAMKQIKGIQK